MKIKVLAFGIAKDIFGCASLEVDMEDGATVQALKKQLEQQYSRLLLLSSYMVAVNNEYAGKETPINANDEVAIIPPVSGG